MSHTQVVTSGSPRTSGMSGSSWMVPMGKLSKYG
jgi:hypothetical protein